MHLIFQSAGHRQDLSLMPHVDKLAMTLSGGNKRLSAACRSAWCAEWAVSSGTTDYVCIGI